jgi:hypothetical protein
MSVGDTGRTGLLVFFFLVHTNSEGSTVDPWERAPAIAEAANSWHVGDPIQPELLRFHQGPGDLPSPMDSGSLISQVKNLPLLAKLSLDLGADYECREDAFAQGMYVGGPTTFFALIRSLMEQQPATANPWIMDIRGRISRPQVVVDALSIDDNDMSAQKASVVLGRIQADLALGKPWHAVYRAYASEFGYKTGHRTKIGNLGHFVLFEDPSLGQGHYVNIEGGVTWEGKPLPRRLARVGFFDASHLPPLLAAKQGDVIRLHSSIYGEYVLYQVQEVYRPAHH